MVQRFDRRLVVFSGLGALAAGCAMAPDKSALSSETIGAEELQGFLEHRILRQRAANAAVIGVLSPAGRRIFSARRPDAGEAYPLSGRTIFEIASLTKVFTALLLAAEVIDGRMGLDDPLQEHLPDGVAAPSFEGLAITLADLATHGAALPLRPNNLANSAADAPDKYAGYTLNALYSGLPNYTLEYAPGSRFRYSNLGFALLGHAIAHHEGAPFEEVLRRRITSPLGLADTALFEDPAKSMRRALDFDLYLDPVEPGGPSALAPAYSLRSTAHDLLRLLELFLNVRGPSRLNKAAQLMLTVDRPGDDDTTRMALGWRRTIAHGETYYWSNGSGDGSRCFMGFNPARKTAVVALADAASGGGLDDIGRRVLDPAQEVDAAVIPAPVFIALPEEVLLRATGRYEYAPDDAFDITRGVTGLIVTAGPIQIIIRPTSQSAYASMMAPGVFLEFDGVDQGPARGVTLRQNGESYYYRRA